MTVASTFGPKEQHQYLTELKELLGVITSEYDKLTVHEILHKICKSKSMKHKKLQTTFKCEILPQSIHEDGNCYSVTLNDTTPYGEEYNLLPKISDLSLIEEIEPIHSSFDSQLDVDDKHIIAENDNKEPIQTDKTKTPKLFTDQQAKGWNIWQCRLGKVYNIFYLPLDYYCSDFIGMTTKTVINLPKFLMDGAIKCLESGEKQILERIVFGLIKYLRTTFAQSFQRLTDNVDNLIYPRPPKHVVEKKDKLLFTNWGNSMHSELNALYSDDIENGSKAQRSLVKLSDIQSVVRRAAENPNLKPIRVFGTSHSWSGHLQTTGTLLDGRKFGWKSENPIDADPFHQETVEKYIDYQYLYVTTNDPLAGGQPTATFPPGIATGTLERWIYYHPMDKHGELIKQQYSLGTSTYEDVFTMGGIVAAACHGTGKNCPTVSDWLVSVEFVDAKGIIRRIRVNGDSHFKVSEDDLWQLWDLSQLNCSGEELFKVAICNYGLLGIMWSLTIRIIPGFQTLFIAQNLPWKDYLSSTEEARKNLNDLQNRSLSLEFFYYPFTTKGTVDFRWEKNSDVYLLRHVLDTEENREMLEKEGFSIVSKPDAYFKIRDGKLNIASNLYSKMISKLLRGPKVIVEQIMPYLLAQFTSNLEFTVTKCKKEAISLPHWRANHSVNAVGAVENMVCSNCEWCLPMTFNDPSGDGLIHTLKVYSHLIESIHAAADKNEFPVSVCTEIRFFRGSGAYLAPEYDPKFTFPDDPFKDSEGKYGGWSAPEIVSLTHNPWWIDFYHQMNSDIYSMIDGEVPVRNHMAKQFGMLKGQFERIRNEFDRESEKPFSKFRDITARIDPEEIFLPPFMKQFVHTSLTEYQPPTGYLVSETGSIPS